jgi:prohibitin 1
LRSVDLKLRILFRPDIKELKKIYEAFGPDYDERIIPSVGHLITKEVIA